jgi:hypothetical protein
MKVFLRSVVLSSFLLVLFYSCDKYPNGPSFSLRTKKARLCNEWILSSYLINGNEFIANQPTVKLAIDKDGTYSISSSETVLGQIQTEYEHGTWTLDAEGTVLALLIDGEEFPSEYTINQLKNDAITLQYYNVQSNQTYLMGYIADK